MIAAAAAGGVTGRSPARRSWAATVDFDFVSNSAERQMSQVGDLILSARVPVALGRAPLLVLLAIFVGIARGLLDCLKGNAFKVRAMDALPIKVLGLCGEALLFGLIWPRIGQPFALLARAGAQKP
jgi:hypothetical protein